MADSRFDKIHETGEGTSQFLGTRHHANQKCYVFVNHKEKNSYNRSCESRNFKWHYFDVILLWCFKFSLPQKRAKAQFLLEKVFEHLELIEKDFFGLQYADLVPAPDAMVTTSLLVARRLLSWQQWVSHDNHISTLSPCVLCIVANGNWASLCFPPQFICCFSGRSVATVTSCNYGKVDYNVSLIFCVDIRVLSTHVHVI